MPARMFAVIRCAKMAKVKKTPSVQRPIHPVRHRSANTYSSPSGSRQTTLLPGLSYTTNFFSPTDRYDFTWEISTDKGVLQRGSFDVPTTPAGRAPGHRRVRPFEPNPAPNTCSAYRPGRGDPLRGPGHIAAQEQFGLPFWKLPP